MNPILINLAGVLVIGLIVWWFWMAKPKARAVTGSGIIDIVVADGVYTPGRIEARVGRPLILRFVRKDPSPCAEKVVFDDFGLTQDLELDQSTDVVLTPDTPGEYEFTCQMKMYRGTLVVSP